MKPTHIFPIPMLEVALLLIIFTLAHPVLAEREITGSITHSNGIPAAGLRVEAWDYDALPDPNDDFMASSLTGPDGSYTLAYEEGDWDQDFFSPANRRPDIYIIVYKQINNQWVKVKSTRTNPRNNVSLNILNLGSEDVTTISGRATDAGGRPMPGITVEPLMQTRGMPLAMTLWEKPVLMLRVITRYGMNMTNGMPTLVHLPTGRISI